MHKMHSVTWYSLAENHKLFQRGTVIHLLQGAHLFRYTEGIKTTGILPFLTSRKKYHLLRKAGAGNKVVTEPESHTGASRMMQTRLTHLE